MTEKAADHKFENRLTRVESMVETLISEWRNERTSIRNELKTVTDSLSNARAPNWGAIAVLATAVGMAGAVIGFMLHGMQANIDRQHVDTTALREHMHQETLGYVRADENYKVRLEILEKLCLPK